MFNDNKNSERVITLLYHYRKIERTLALAEIDALMMDLKEARDDLRLLFYLGVDCDSEAYEHALKHVEGVARSGDNDTAYRCGQFVKAVQMVVPESKAEYRKYLIDRFLEVTGYKPD